MSSGDFENLEAFREAAFGMFVHWGLYSIPAGVWKGMETPAEGEWLMRTMRIPIAEYASLAKKFAPKKFDAAKWVALAKKAGMKYLVVTAKHHDGFAMYRSRCDKYNVADATPFKRDPLAELAEACAKENMKLGFYYSQDQDWHEPGGFGNDWDFARKYSDVDKIEGEAEWPSTWRVFGPFNSSDEIPTGESLRQVPDELRLSGIEAKGRDIAARDGSIDFEEAFGTLSPRRAVYAFAKLRVEKDSTITVGAGSEWWMEWLLDGKPVMDTSKHGNGCKPVAIWNHVFNLRLSAGEHVLAVRVVSGEAGAKLVSGGPYELRRSGWLPAANGVDSKKEFAKYLERKVKPQLKELLTNYGPVAIIWFDTPYAIAKEQSLALKSYVHSLQPKCLVSGRVGNGMGDYESLCDNQMPPSILRGTWEGLGTTNQSWGFKSADCDWKSPRRLLEILVEHAAKNANYLLNVGPDADGEIPAPAAEALTKLGAWLRVNGEAIYGAQALDFIPRVTWGYAVKKRDRLFLIPLWPPKNGRLVFFGLQSKVEKICLLSAKTAKLRFNDIHKNGCYAKLEIELPSDLAARPMPEVVEIQASSEIRLNSNAYSCNGVLASTVRTCL